MRYNSKGNELPRVDFVAFSCSFLNKLDLLITPLKTLMTPRKTELIFRLFLSL